MAFDGEQQTLDAVRQLRQACGQNGYRPLEVYNPGALDHDGKPIPSAGKRPVGSNWRELALRNPPVAVGRKVSSQATNTGILTGELSGLDVDVLDQEITDGIVAMIEAMLGPTPLSRIGRAPKILLCYRAEQPFAKLSTPKYRLPDGSAAQLEILGDGQQFVAFGTHPDTMRPFEWPARSPLDVPLAALPTISAMQARDIVGLANSILIEAGGVIEKPESDPNRGGRSADSGQFFRSVNDAALADIVAWAPCFGFHDRGGNSGWRITSKELGRPLQEDVSIHPTGIWDFGEEKPLTAIDVVIKFGGAPDAVQAALWLCDKLGKDPALLGWGGKPTPPGPKPGEPGISSPHFLDPWEVLELPTWPVGVLPPIFEDMVFTAAASSGVDPAAYGLATFAAVSGAAPKNMRFQAYGSLSVPPLIWGMVVAPPGYRKSTLDPPFAALARQDAIAARNWRIAVGEWSQLKPKDRGEKPPEPHWCIITDTTPEKLQEVLSRTLRGSLYKRDELAGFFAFGRYNAESANAERAFYLQSYDAAEEAFGVFRRSRDTLHVEVNGLTIFGTIQPTLLAKIPGLADDGMLQRFIVMQAAPPTLSQPAVKIANKDEFDALIDDLSRRSGGTYTTLPEGSGMLHAMEAYALDLGQYRELGEAFAGFGGKLNGTTARLALLLHLIEDGAQAPVAVPVGPETIARAERLVREFVLPHARAFYTSLSPEPAELRQAIAAWLLAEAPEEFVASDLHFAIFAVRKMNLPAINAVLEPFMNGGWLEPSPRSRNFPHHPHNAWKLDVRVRNALAHRVPTAHARRERNRRIAATIRSGRKENG